MKTKGIMKKIIAILILSSIIITAFASTPEKIVLEKPNLKRGMSMMETLSKRKSSRAFSEKTLSKEDLSDLLWATNGVNREDGKRTAPSAKNKQDIDTYAFFKTGAYKYDHVNHTLVLVAKGDHRKIFGGGRQAFVATAPVVLLHVGDASKFAEFGEEMSKIVTAIDAGIVTQNVNLFCAAIGLANVPRTSMDKEGVIAVLKLPETRIPLINNVVGYPK